MKKILAVFLCLCLAAMAAGCGEDGPESTGGSTAPSQSATPLLAALVLEPVTDSLLADGTQLFSSFYQRPQLQLAHSQTAAQIQEDLVSRQDSFLEHAQQIRSYAQNDYSGQDPWDPYTAQQRALVTRFDGRVLSLEQRIEYYSGSAHPITMVKGVSYDLSSGKALELKDILAADFSAEGLARQICQALSPMADGLYPGYEEQILARLAPDAQTPLSWCLTAEGLCFLFSPYELAPAAIGPVTAQIPYDDLEGFILDAYLPATDQPGGVLALSPAAGEEEAAQVQVTLDPEGQPLLLTCDGQVTDLVLELGDQTAAGFVPRCTVLALPSLQTGQKIAVRASFPADGPALRLTYRSRGLLTSLLMTVDQATGSVVLR